MPDVTTWGNDVRRTTVSGHPCLALEPHPQSLAEMFSGLSRWAARDCLIYGDRRLTFADVVAAIPVAAVRLRERHVAPGTRVMVLAYNSPEWVLSLLAIWSCGAVPVMGNRWWSAAELEHCIALAEPVLVITDAAASSLPADTSRMDITILDTAFELAADGARGSTDDIEFADLGEDSPALVVFTSGSSGRPKGVVLSTRSVIANQHNLLARSRRLPDSLSPDDPQSATLLCTPLFHIGGITAMLLNLLTGTKTVMTVGRFDPGDVLRLLAEEQITSFGGVPTMAVRILEQRDFEKYNLASLHSWPLGGAPVPPSLLDRMRRSLPQLEHRGLGNTWGMTESGGHLTGAGARDLAERPGTVGRPYPAVELRIAHPDDSGLGEILARSPTVMLGYLKGAAGPEETGVDNDGWLHTGDVGRLDADGYLFVVSRSKDIIIRGGENIACSHVEFAIAEHSDVVEAAVIGIPHDELGEEVAAVVVVRPQSAVDENDLRQFVQARLAYFEVPSHWRIQYERLPTLAGEKIDKRTVRGELLEQLAAAEGQDR